MSEKLIADNEALRREQRRKKILQFSEKRLASIIGRPVTTSSEDKPKSNTCFNDHIFPCVNETELLPQRDHFIKPEEDIDREIPLYNTPLNYNVNDKIQVKNENKTESSWIKSLVRRRLHYIILPLIVQLLYVYNLGFLFYNNLFCPFITMKLMEFLLLQEPMGMEKQGLLTLVASITKGPMIVLMYRAYSIFSVIVSDFFLYIFLIVASNKLLNVYVST